MGLGLREGEKIKGRKIGEEIVCQLAKHKYFAVCSYNPISC